MISDREEVVCEIAEFVSNVLVLFCEKDSLTAANGVAYVRVNGSGRDNQNM